MPGQKSGAVMGYLSASEMRRHLTEKQALTWHLQHNHYPPISLAYLPLVREALGCARAGDFDNHVQLPSGRFVSVSQIVEFFNLDAFLEPDPMEESND